ncbi:hypothetical protein T484DRAFT_1858293 [Baffinella frigidus]|nr:hypothetical protein T484DRAFT_1858293 [Cryptophyta sp. CCMP2293]
MPDNPYHNFFHAIDVLQTTIALATATGVMARLDSWERFALLSAAFCHDMDHAGVSKQFLSQAGDSTHGGHLEKHHALHAFGAMADRDIRVLDGLTSSQYYQFRSSVSKIILSTDLTRHSYYITRLREFAALRAQDPAVEMDKQLAMELMVKCADVSNVIKPVEVARRWTLRVTDEFFDQGDAERCMGMEVSPNCDRFATSRVALQTAFIDCLAAPLFTHLAAAFPAALSEPGETSRPRPPLEAPLLQLAANRASYALCSELELEQSRGVLDSDSACSETQTEEGVGGGGSLVGGSPLSPVGSREERCDSPSSETREGEGCMGGEVGEEVVVSKREPLNDTTRSTKRVFRKSPPPPINRQRFTSEIDEAAPHHDDTSKDGAPSASKDSQPWVGRSMRKN